VTDLFALQLEIENLTDDQIRERAVALRPVFAPHQRLGWSVQVLVGVMRSPTLTEAEKRGRIRAWCEGLGISDADVWRIFESHLAKARDDAERADIEKGGA
jgi:hypothetical protein